MPMKTEYTFGVLLVIVSAVIFSTAGLFSKGVAATSWEIIFWRGVFSTVFIVGWTLYNGVFADNFFRMGWSGLSAAIAGAFGTAAFIAAFKLTTVANVSMIYAIAPIFAAAFAWLWIGERLSRRLVFGCIGAFAGVTIIVYGSLGQINLQGDALALFMTAAMAILMVIYRRYPKTPGAGPSALSALLLLLPALMLGDPPAIPLGEIAILAAFGLVFALASVALAEGSKRVPSAQTALLGTLETPLAPVLAYLVLSEVPGEATMVGGALVFIAVVYTTRENT